MEKKPDFLIVGAAKAGTTSIYYYLKQHPNIWFPKIKETKYFSSKIKKYPQKGRGDWSIDQAAITDSKKYYELFSNSPKGSLKGEASPDYLLFAKEIAPKIREELGDIPIIISIRNPIQRAYSAYSNMIRDNREFLDFHSALKEEGKRIENNWDFMWYYTKSGFYINQIEEFEKYFSKVKVIFFDDLISSPLEATNDILSFLGVKPTLVSLKSTAYNPSGIPSNIISKFLLNRNSRLSVNLRNLIKLIVPRELLEYLARMSLSKNTISREEFDLLKGIYSQEIKALEDKFNRDLSGWIKN